MDLPLASTRNYKTQLKTLLQEHPDAIAAIVCAIFVVVGWLALHLNWISLALFLLPVAYVIGGYGSAKEGLTTLWEEKELDVDLLMIVAALGAAILGLWRREYYLIVDGGVLILIFAVSGALEGYAMQRTENAIRSLMSLTPDTARILVCGEEREVSINKLLVGSLVIVKPGEMIPCDCIITDGFSSINQSAITGESLPIEKTIGDEVFGGTINGNGALKLRVHQPPESSLIQRIVKQVLQAQTEAPPSQLFLERFERSYAKVIVFVGVILATLPPFILNWDWETTIYKALIFLVVASPCALMAAIMPTLLSGIANGARQGILFKSGSHLERIGKVNAIAFDKTGTLTTGKPEVVEIIPVSGCSEIQVLQIAAAVELFSEHPIGKAVVNFAEIRNLTLPTANNVQALAGFGITAEIDNQKIILGKTGLIQQEVGEIPQSLIQLSQELAASEKTIIWVAQAGKILGLITVADSIREEARFLIQKLQKMGIQKVIMLTGDNQLAAQNIAQKLGITEVYAELLPEDKVSIIKQLKKEYGNVTMVGDGINDAPALATATVGIAMGIAGNDIALETADIVLMSDNLAKITTAIKLGDRTLKIIKQNITFALSFIVVLLIANFATNLTLPIGVIGHEGSTILVTLNGLRLLRQ
ncbi:heavy metal translocating P-type ATPase [Calothrix sp. UHCC 0171]|uniref:heavy metal translocating P-type ATPase n=1 Tax=Calothrix sp. UHCC 0171 TaxID=3110245 RepID=UPI002B1F9AA8|nr:heavy metal translocating P-type ATPase [Calothrix sp. UHCC 0171]MEA5572196.1 heavy metal translocating P-type ATPase [Calothrix sp. UHCC 0171]